MKPPKHECAWCEQGFTTDDIPLPARYHERCWTAALAAGAAFVAKVVAQTEAGPEIATGATIFIHEMNADVEVNPGDVVHVLGQNATVRVREKR